jgi:bifunctional DNA-binding transcriptional regulator/antitoxin component of YhaV-PrlF toxin-antitoxin module
MPDERKVLGRRGQMLVAIPARARRALGLAPGRSVWFHYPRTGEVVVSIKEARTGGKPPADLPCPHCETRERELAELRARLQAREGGSARQYFTQGYEQAVRHHGALAVKLDVALDFLRELTGRAPRTSHRSKRRDRRWARDIETAPGPDQYPSPPPSPSPASSEEGADTSGAQLPGVPLEH